MESQSLAGNQCYYKFIDRIGKAVVFNMFIKVQVKWMVRMGSIKCLNGGKRLKNINKETSLSGLPKFSPKTQV